MTHILSSGDPIATSQEAEEAAAQHRRAASNILPDKQDPSALIASEARAYAKHMHEADALTEHAARLSEFERLARLVGAGPSSIESVETFLRDFEVVTS